MGGTVVFIPLWKERIEPKTEPKKKKSTRDWLFV